MIDIIRVVLQPEWLTDDARLTVFSHSEVVFDCNPDKLFYDVDVAGHEYVGVQVGSLNAQYVYVNSFASDRSGMFTVLPILRTEDRTYSNA